MQRIAILGSTGSIGTSALDVISRFPDRFKVASLSTNSNIKLLSDQVKKFRSRAVCVVDARKAKQFQQKRYNVKVYEGEQGLCRMLEDIKVDTAVVGIVGSSALLPILKAISNVKRVALANKEALVMAGDIIMKTAKKKNVELLPVDSEHSAVFQCIAANNERDIKNIYLTSSGGPLLNTPKSELKNISPRQAISHPKWKMGKKISVDSATMMNKGLEVIEAHHLFGTEVNRIKVLIHPETAVHSMVEFIDGSILAQMSACDMRMPIQYALTYPSRSISPVKGIAFSELRSLHFHQPDFRRFPCLEMAYEAARRGKGSTCALNASNEVAVKEFLKGRINFTDIPRAVEKILNLHKGGKGLRLQDILEIDAWARQKTKEILDAINS